MGQGASCCGRASDSEGDERMSWEREMQEACCDFPTCERQAYQRGLADARKACIAELLDDPQPGTGDETYDSAIHDCIFAIEELISHERHDE